MPIPSDAPMYEGKASGAVGTEDRLAALYAAVSASLLKRAIRLGLTREDAEDCVQETWLRVVADLQRLTTVQNPTAWIYRVFRNIVIDHRRRLRASQVRLLEYIPPYPVALPGKSPQAQDLAVKRELAQSDEIADALQALPERQSLAVGLTKLFGLSIQEVAAILGCAPGTVKVHIHRGIRALRSKLVAEPIDPDDLE